MRLAIMQPYLFPYIGYFQLIAAVDRFVFYDDVSFIKQGWINRNRLLGPRGATYFTVPVVHASSSRAIRDTLIDHDVPWEKKLLRRVSIDYARAPLVSRVMRLLEDVLSDRPRDIASLSRKSIEAVCEYLGISTERVASSIGYENGHLHGADRVLDICRREAADTYVNMAGGRGLYDPESFAGRGVTLRFLTPRVVSYRQFGAAFVPSLSILDVLMFNDVPAARGLLGEYDLA